MIQQNYNDQQTKSMVQSHLHSYKNSLNSISSGLSKSIQAHRQSHVSQTKKLSKIQNKWQQSLYSSGKGNVQQSYEIYFSRTKKYNYMKNIIDKYFEDNNKCSITPKYSTINPEDLLRPTKPISLIPRLAKNEFNNRNQKQEHSSNISHHLQMISKRRSKQISNRVKKNQQQDLNNNISLSYSTINPQESAQSESLFRNLSFSSTKNVSNLPPINQHFEQKEESLNDPMYKSINLLSESQIMQDYKQQKMISQENDICFTEIVKINDKINHKLKTYKEKGQEILNRQIKAINLGIQPIWIQYKFNKQSLITSPNKSMKELLFKVSRQDTQGKIYTIKAKNYHKKLIANNCEELKRIIVDYCQHMNTFAGRILNNKVHLGNLFIAKNQNIRLGEWGFSCFRQSYTIQQRQFQNRIEPVLKSQNQWFVPPQYLAPEILKAILGNQDLDLMNNQSASDIWSLGLAIFQILTMIPVGISQKFTVEGKSISRCGILFSKDLKKMLAKEQKLSYLSRKLIQEQLKDEKIDLRLVQVISSCLRYDHQSRPTYQQIIQALR